MKKPVPSNLVTVVIDMRFPLEQLDRAVELLVSSVGRTEAKPGCRECLVTKDALGEGHIRYSEAWDSEEAFHRHLRSDEFHRVLVAMDMGRVEPQVVIGNLAGRSGLDYLRDLRLGKGQRP